MYHKHVEPTQSFLFVRVDWNRWFLPTPMPGTEVDCAGRDMSLAFNCQQSRSSY